MRLLLGAIALGLLALLVAQWRDWPPPPERGTEASEAATPEVDTRPEARGPLELLEVPTEKEEYAVVTERPLFMPDRRPPTEEPDAEGEDPTADAEQTDLTRLDLSAVVITPEESTAWVRDPAEAELRKLRLGDELEGWTVTGIRGDELELERQGETDTLVLRDYEHSPPPVVQPPRGLARPPVRPGEQRPLPVNRPNPPPRPQVRPPRARSNVQRLPRP